MESKIKIFISAYACEPDLGSEIGVGWHWVIEMSNYFDLWVLTRASNEKRISIWLKKHEQYKRIHFIYYDLPYWMRFWKKGLRGVRIYYNLWQYFTNHIVKREMISNSIKIFHHLTYGNALWKVSSYGKKQFFIWGPIGGVETIPKEYTDCYYFRSKYQESLRRFIVEHLNLNRIFIKNCESANLILCKTEILKNAIPFQYRNKSYLFTDVAINSDLLRSSNVELRKSNKRIEFLSVGHLDSWRGFDLVIEAFAKARKISDNIHLTIVGEGIDKERLIKMINHYNLINLVTLIGNLSINQYYNRMRDADVIVNAALKEGAVTVSLDSVAMGKPLLCINTTGYTHLLSQDYSIIVDKKDREYTIKKICNGIVRLIDNNLRYEMGKKAQIAARKYTWSCQGEKIYDIIINALKNK